MSDIAAKVDEKREVLESLADSDLPAAEVASALLEVTTE